MIGEPIPGASDPEGQPSSARNPELSEKPAVGMGKVLSEQQRAGGNTGDMLRKLAGQDSESKPAPEHAERNKQVDEMQTVLRKLNNDPTVAGRMLAEIPLGDGTDRVAMVLRPRAIGEVDWARQLPDDLSLKIKDATPSIRDDLDIMNKSSLIQATQHKILAVLPEIGPVRITPAQESAGMTIPGSLKSEVQRIIATQGATANGTFLEMMKHDGLKFAQHRGMERDDSAS